MARHSRKRVDFPGTGGELARHLLDEAGLAHVKVEAVSHFEVLEEFAYSYAPRWALDIVGQTAGLEISI
nr:zinc metallopeptidase [Nordella sp. HKS 07]